MVPARNYDTFADAIFKKLITEIAGAAPAFNSRAAQPPLPRARLLFQPRQRIGHRQRGERAIRHPHLADALSLRDHAHIPLTRGGWFLFLAQAAGVAGRIGLAAWSDRTAGARFRLLALCMIAVAAGALLLIFIPPDTPEPALAILAAWLGFFGLGWYGRCRGEL
jgi:hypothetical protein